MGKKMSINNRLLYSFLLYPVAALFLISGCATGSTKDAATGGEESSITVQQTESGPSVQQNNDNAWKSVTDTSTAAPQIKVEDEPETTAVEIAVADESEDITPSEPRIFFEPSRTDINEVLGIDFTLAENGKSRLVVTTTKKTNYDLDRKDEKTLVLKIHDSTIANPLLMRHIDTTQFQSALEVINQKYSSQNKEVDLVLSLREIVPFNIKPTENGLIMDFGQTSVKVAETKIVPLNLEETETRTLAVTSHGSGIPTEASTITTATATTKKYKGERMYMDFVDADVTHILRLINEVSGENIVWDPSIAGKKVSMILKNVPWDEALDLVLDNNDLAKRYRGDNILWITTKDKMKQILAEEEAERQRLLKLAEEAENRRKEKEKAAKEEAPLITEYLPVDFAKANDVKGHITVSKRGAMTVDTRTNTIILTDIEENIETAKKTIKQFDTPVKQIMIEARIVEATDSFSRELGLKWNNNTSYWDTDALNEDIEVPPFANDFNYDGERVYGGSFSTNSPDGWDANIGLGFARATFGGRLTLDASLAIAESEGTAKTLSAPKVIAQEGTPAKISSGEIIKVAATENVASEEWPAELSLSVTPNSISYNDYITLTVDVSDDARLSDSLKTTKTINTTLMVKSGETIVIGGIIKEKEGEDTTGVPILKDIPVLGWLFKAKSKSTSRSELLIFLTPTVLSSFVD
ncbi:MAG: type IV pilus secretin PilQ [Deltaproteobacteria bacterium]|nr:type IV pilus secretin PilQ [Deltaproteobacteria bacterium]